METIHKKNRFYGIDWAVLLICAGVLFLLFNLGIIPGVFKPILISWQMFLIILGVSFFCKRKYPSGFILFLIGIIFIYPKVYRAFPDYLADINIDFRTYWPLILIAIGLSLILGKSNCRKRNRYLDLDSEDEESDSFNKRSFNKAEYLDKNLMFSSYEHIVLSPNFRGGDGNVMFGELKIDLRKASLKGNKAQLELNVMFGSTIIYVPSNWIVDIQNSALFGDFRDNRSLQDVDVDAPRLIISGGCLFGSGEIRN